MASEDRRRKNALSCDGCRQRKVKCEKPSSGPCQRCSRLGKQCLLGNSTSRPYYHTSKERYELMVTVVRHFVPTASFGTEDLRRLVKTLSATLVDSSLLTATDGWSGGPGQWLPETITQAHTPPATATPAPSQGCAIEDLKDSLFVDAMNVPRLSGSSSCTTLNAKIVSHLSKRPENLSPFHESEPTPLFDGRVLSCRTAQCLPNRKALDQAAVKFFAEINSVIYILDQDRFYLWVDEVYRGQGVRASVLVILYMVMALCGEKDPNFDIARSSIDDVIEESSLESVRAILLISLYRQRENQRVVSWTMLGVAVRIAISLALHREIGYSQDLSEYGSEIKRRVWWSLCEFDNWTSCMLGLPSGLGHRDHHVSLPSMEFNSSPYNPPGYATASASLGILIGQISQQLYIENGNLTSKEQVTSMLIRRVEHWNHELPDHLRPDSKFASSFARATLYLNLKYNYTRMLIGRPYLTHSILCSNTHDKLFESRAETCRLANQESIAVLQELYQRGLLSSSLWLDTYFTLATAIILFLRAVETPSMLVDLKAFLPVLKLCGESKVGEYAITNFENFLQILEGSGTEKQPGNLAGLLTHSPPPDDMSTACHGIDIHDLEDFNTMASECFSFAQNFGLDLCGVDSGLN